MRAIGIVRAHMPESLWNRIADLPLAVESHAVEHLHAPAQADRTTLLVRLRGRGAEGLGEDVGGTMIDEDGRFVAAAPDLALAGDWTLASFVDRLASLDLWPDPPQWEMARRWRTWAFESAALDLALQQAGVGLAEALGREPAPVRFVNSLGLGEPPEFEAVGRRLERYPGLRFKLDAQATWSSELTARVAGTGAVDVVDFKGRYGLAVEDESALVAMYEAVLERFDEAILEDPHDLPEVDALIETRAARVSFDAPIAGVHDVVAAAFGARIVNVKPSRIGSLRALLDVYAHCDAHGLRMYGGGMGEVGIARGQIQLLAALFHPDEPNDVAPSAYNLPDLADGLPESPLVPGPSAPGFRWG
jgi:L-alanine-DL-glutamate epimerase-like enolase superfamily enzyme